ncbi:MAG: amidohydrolase family protein, partial [Gammaproteobacteria bacterium]
EIEVGNIDSQCHVLPPLRTQRDREGLRSGLAQGTLLAVCSDHQPHEADAKLAPFAATAAGISALDTLLPLSLRLVEDGALSLPELIARLTCRPAQLLGTKLGTLGVGTVADLCLFDPNEEWEFAAAHMHSRGHNTPFLGWQFKGRIVMTVFGGDVVFERAAHTSAG